MKVIFLDVDGVLNSHKYFAKTDVEEIGIYTNLDKTKLGLLKKIIRKTKAKIVLSSSWRLSFDDNLIPDDYLGQSLISALKNEGLAIFGKTDDLQNDRYYEIKDWLQKHANVNDFVILDDDDFNWKDLHSQWIKTSYYIGLTKDIAEKTIKKLNTGTTNR